MLLKWIICDVPEAKRDAFSRAQAAWSEIAGVAGLVGQVGGWSQSSPAKACILSVWEDAERYKAFMGGPHDAVVQRSAQRGTYEAIAISLFDSVNEMPGSAGGLRDALRTGTLLRASDCSVRSGRERHFIEVQHSVWTPAMARAEGMLGGVFSRECGAAPRWLVATLWSDPGLHARYVAVRVPGLRARTSGEDDLERIDANIVPLETAWRVGTSSDAQG